MKSTLASAFLAVGLSLVPMGASAQQILTNIPPPAPIAETQPPAPSTAHIWIGGYWTWGGTQYTWTPGHWEQPQQQGTAWEAPQWQQEGGRYRWRPGRWRRREEMQVIQPGMQVGPQGQVIQPGMPQPGVVVVPPQPPGVVVVQPQVPQPPAVVVQPQQPPGVVMVAPPRVRFERRPRMAPPGQVWVPGYWNWNGQQHVWVQGHFEAQPRPNAVWVQPRWGRRGRQWIMTPGQWR